jgi:hypothetical protein
MHERAPRKETIGRGELFFLSHLGTEETFSGYGLTMQQGTEELLVGLLMIDRPRQADAEWLAEVETTFGECELVAMTPAGERGIACQMQIEPESLPRPYSVCLQLSAAGGKLPSPAMVGRPPPVGQQPLLVNPPNPAFTLRWDEEARNWHSEFAAVADLPEEIRQVFEGFGYGCLRRRASAWSTSATRPIATLRALPTSPPHTSGSSSRCPPLR